MSYGDPFYVTDFTTAETSKQQRDARESPADQDRRRHNAWVQSMQDEVEFQPLLDFLDRLKEPEQEPKQ